MALPGASFEDFTNLRKGKIDFVVEIIKVRRDTDAGVGTIVDQDIASEQFAFYFLGVRAVDGNSAASCFGGFRRIYLPAQRFGAIEKALGLFLGFFPDLLNAHLANYFKSWLAGVESRYVRSAIQKTIRIVTKLVGSDFELEGMLMGAPASKSRGEFLAQIRPHIQIGDAWPAA